MRYRFGVNRAETKTDRIIQEQSEPAGIVWVGRQLYASSRDGIQYGFLTEKNRRGKLAIPELNSGFDAVYWLQGQEVTQICADEQGCYVEYHGEGEIPLTFVTDVPCEGNYSVTVTVTVPEGVEKTETLIFIGRRRLAWRGFLAPGSYTFAGLPANICPIIPRTYIEAMEDLTLDITLIGRDVHLTEVAVEPWEGNTIYIAGDSTVTDQSTDYPYLPGNSYSGWGQMLSCYITDMAISNHAHSGLTTESFRSEGHYEILLSRLQKNDICLLQFGHNDQKLMHLMAETGYRQNLLTYIREIREQGARPVLVTPLARNSFKGDGSYNDLLEPYADACICLARECEVPCIDLHGYSMAWIKKHGRDSAKRYFFPSDYTHSNDYGAFLFASYIAAEMRRQGLLTGAKWEEGEKGCEKLPMIAEWKVPQEISVRKVPKEYQNVKNPMEVPLFLDLENPKGILTRVEAFSFVIMTMHFFPTNVYNDMFTDVIGHETYAGTVECAWQNGMIPESMIESRKIYPQREITGGEFLEVLLRGYQSRKSLPEGCKDIYDAARRMKILPQGFAVDQVMIREQAAEMCRKLSI